MIKQETKNVYIQGVNRVIDHINAECGEKLCLQDLAEIAYISPFHFHRIFKAMMGETLQEYICRIRLEKAVFLMDQEKSLTDISMQSGFATPSHFAKAFKERFGISPSLYKRQRNFKNSKILTVSKAEIPHISISNEEPQWQTRVFPDLRIAYIRHIGKYNHKIGFAWKNLMQWARQNDVLRQNTMRISCSYDDPDLTPEGKLRYDACITVPDDAVASGTVSIRKIAGGNYAGFSYQGLQSKLDIFYDLVYGQLLPASSKRLADAPGFRLHLESREEQIKGLCNNILYVPLAD